MSARFTTIWRRLVERRRARYNTASARSLSGDAAFISSEVVTLSSKHSPRRLSAAALLLALAAWPCAAVEVKIFRADNAEAFAEGTLDGLALDPSGTLTLASQVERRAEIAEPFVFNAAAAADGWILGTGNAGKLLHAAADGSLRELWAAPDDEIQIHAVLADGAGKVVAATSPTGKVYFLEDDPDAPGTLRQSALFDPEATYIWALARDAEGRLLVATGLPGRIFRVGADGVGEVLWESPDAHVRALFPLPGGGLLAGTAGQGLIVHLDAKGTARILHDAAQPEIVAFTPGPGGAVYAAALASEASQVDLSSSADENGDEDGEAVAVSDAVLTVGSRGAGDDGARSVLLEIRLDGSAATVEEIEWLADETIHSLAVFDGDLWIGTGENGRLYRREADGLLLERELDGRQVTALAAGPAGLAALTTNAAALYVAPGVRAAQGTYTSRILDAGSVARFGALRLEGELPPDATIRLEARSGMSKIADRTWTSWTAVGDGLDAALDTLGEGRYVQWRATLDRSARRKADAEDGGPRLRIAELSYRQHNDRPRLTALEVLAPGEILVPSAFNAQNQVFEPWSPNREGIFTSLRQSADNGGGVFKTLWKRGYRTVRWTAEDPNQDTVEATLAFRRAQDGASGNRGDDGWINMIEELDESHYSFDATVLPDGLYHFRVTVDDGPSNVDFDARSVSRTSPPVTIDHTPPRMVRVEHSRVEHSRVEHSRVERQGATLEVELEDALSPIRQVEWSVDAAEWKPAPAVDGLLDERREILRLEIPPGARLVLLRAHDAALNVVTFDLTDSP